MTSFTVNGQPVHYRMDPATPLLWALRDASNLTGTKFGCGTGHCGACMVHVDGNAVRSCRVAIGQLEGSFVTTIEGLSRDRSHPVQQAFAANMVPQCGYCIPGVIMAAAALVDRNDSVTDAQIDAAIPNLCRCGIYPRLRDSIRRAIRIKNGAEQVGAAPPPGVSPEEAARAVPALRAPPQPPRRRGTGD
jgi:isoquinoline 1-oxidoreductase alpha subunit